MAGQSCPIEGRTVDATAGRIASLLVTALLLAALLTPAKWVLFVVLAEYAIRVVAGPGSGPLCWLGRQTARTLQLRRRSVDVAPKRFAAWVAVGFLLSGIAATYILEAPAVAAFAIGVFAACAFLDGALGVCVGCRLYGVIRRVRHAPSRTGPPVLEERKGAAACAPEAPARSGERAA